MKDVETRLTRSLEAKAQEIIDSVPWVSTWDRKECEHALKVITEMEDALRVLRGAVKHCLYTMETGKDELS